VLQQCLTLHTIFTCSIVLPLNTVLPLCPRCVLSPGKVCDEEHMAMDIKLMKAANINAVRCSHYPNDSRW
jgi:hypothetical protein